MNTSCSQLAWPWLARYGECLESLLHGGERASYFMFVPYHVIVVGLRLKWYTLYKQMLQNEQGK